MLAMEVYYLISNVQVKSDVKQTHKNTPEEILISPREEKISNDMEVERKR